MSTGLMTWYLILIFAVGVERLVELVLAQRNLAWSRGRGGVEVGTGHYPAMVVLHWGRVSVENSALARLS